MRGYSAQPLTNDSWGGNSWCLLTKYGIAIPKSNITCNSDGAETIAREIDKPVVLKSQILVSSRGKSGGVIFTNDTTGTKKAASNLIGSAIWGSVVRGMLVEEN